ncbi:MAG: MotA/TolQ/ExbB proton channel family protein [Actinobacteria bacterium]|nr:MotA/TolQ/ExbB proton channel family protein [Actinomycetota bacterium]
MLLPIGMVLSLVFMLASVVMEGGNPMALVAIPSVVLVFGGTLAASATAFTFGEVLRMPKMAIKGFSKPAELGGTISQLCELAEVARKEGALALEGRIAEVDDPFLQHGLTLLVDGADEHRIQDELDAALSAIADRHQRNISLWTKAAGYAPIFGLMGTTMGLINMLGHLDKPEEIGPSLAVAMTATLYGLVSSNVMFTPIADKLTRLHESEMLVKEMMIDGVCSILHGFSSRAMTERLEIWLQPAARAAEKAA